MSIKLQKLWIGTDDLSCQLQPPCQMRLWHHRSVCYGSRMLKQASILQSFNCNRKAATRVDVIESGIASQLTRGDIFTRTNLLDEIHLDQLVYLSLWNCYLSAEQSVSNNVVMKIKHISYHMAQLGIGSFKASMRAPQHSA